jgi:hypothetical protein
MVSRPPLFSWLLEHRSQLANRLPNLRYDSKGSARFVQDRRAAKVLGARIGKAEWQGLNDFLCSWNCVG